MSGRKASTTFTSSLVLQGQHRRVQPQPLDHAVAHTSNCLLCERIVHEGLMSSSIFFDLQLCAQYVAAVDSFHFSLMISTTMQIRPTSRWRDNLSVDLILSLELMHSFWRCLSMASLAWFQARWWDQIDLTITILRQPVGQVTYLH